MRYSKDPYWIHVRWATSCAHCSKPLPKGSRAFYYPIGRKLYGDSCGCGHTAAGGFNRASFNESMATGRW